MIVAYDINRSGQWTSTGGNAGYFGYRLRQGSLEGRRGISHCNETGWERLLDHHEMRIESFNVVVSKGNSGKNLARLTLAGCSTADSSIRRRLSWQSIWPHCHERAFTAGGSTLAAVMLLLVIRLMLLNAQHRQLDHALLLAGGQQRYLLAYNQAASALSWKMAQRWPRDQLTINSWLCRQAPG